MRRPRTYRMMAEINVTNLVDVVLVLLIVFMISAPLLQSGIDIDLPKTTYVDKELAEGVVITINKKGGIFIDDVYSRPEQLEEKLTEYIGKKKISAIYLRGDKDVKYGIVIDVVARLKKMGIADVGLVTKTFDEDEPR